MLKQDELTLALIAGQKQADACGHFCSVGAAITDGSPTMSIWHNGIGSSDSDHQIVHATAILSYDKDKLGEHLGKWLVAIHKREKLDLNIVR